MRRDHWLPKVSGFLSGIHLVQRLRTSEFGLKTPLIRSIHDLVEAAAWVGAPRLIEHVEVIGHSAIVDVIRRVKLGDGVTRFTDQTDGKVG